MLQSHLFASGRSRIYWDGAALQAHAEALGDPSLNWLDLPALARAAGIAGDHVWVAPALAAQRGRRDVLDAYGAALRALGVDCRAVAGAGPEVECLRCGHGWTDGRAPSELTLSLKVLADAVEDVWDVAFIFASAAAVAAIAEPLGRLFPGKRLGRVVFGPSPRLRRGAPITAIRSADVAAARLPSPIRAIAPARALHPTIQPAAQEASPCP